MLKHKDFKGQLTIFGDIDVYIEVGSAEPFIKWVGGKRNVYKDIIKRLPTEINNYYEPCVGGGGVFYMLHNRIKGKSFLYDVNPRLVNAYNQVKKHPNELIEALSPSR